MIIKFKHGNLADLPMLLENEIIYIDDTKELCVGVKGGHKVIAVGKQFASIKTIYNKERSRYIISFKQITSSKPEEKPKVFSWWKKLWSFRFARRNYEYRKLGRKETVE